MSGLTIPDRIALIRAAIVRVRESRERYRLLGNNPLADSVLIESARDSYTSALREFGWQAENVEAALNALMPEEK